MATAAATVTAEFDCKNIEQDGFKFDLSPLAQEITLETNVTTPPTVTGTKYFINPCAALKPPSSSVPEIDRCPKDAWVCRTVTNYKEKEKEKARVTEVGAVAGIKSSDTPQLKAKTQEDGKLDQLQWGMAGAEVEGKKWGANINFICDKNAKNEDLPKLVGFDDGALTLEWSVPAACVLGDNDKGKDKGSDDDNKDKKKSGGGFFSSLFTLLVLGFVLYFVLGVMYKYLVVRASGPDLIPNRRFWGEFPSLCVEYTQHLWDTVSGRNRGGYSVV